MPVFISYLILQNLLELNNFVHTASNFYHVLPNLTKFVQVLAVKKLGGLGNGPDRSWLVSGRDQIYRRRTGGKKHGLRLAMSPGYKVLVVGEKLQMY